MMEIKKYTDRVPTVEKMTKVNGKVRHRQKEWSGNEKVRQPTGSILWMVSAEIVASLFTFFMFVLSRPQR